MSDLSSLIADQNEIPADIKTRAGAASCEFFARVAEGESEADVIISIVSAAVASEREACARKAEALDRCGRDWVPDSLWDRVKRDTAHSIRHGHFPLRALQQKGSSNG